MMFTRIFSREFFFLAIKFFLAFFLLTSFLLHTGVFTHDHDKRFFGVFQAVTHGEEKKWLFDVSPALTEALLSVPATFFFEGFFIAAFCLVRDPLREALRRGIMHPKLYS